MSNCSQGICSYGPLTQQYGSVPIYIQPCAVSAAYNGTGILPNAYVTPGEVVEVVLGGTPPYNVSSAHILNNGTDVCASGTSFVLNSTSFYWDVGKNATSDSNSTISYGDAMWNVPKRALKPSIFSAVMNSSENAQGQYPWYVSYKFYISNNTNGLGDGNATAAGTGKSSASRLESSWKLGTIAIIGLVASLVLP